MRRRKVDRRCDLEKCGNGDEQTEESDRRANYD
jgi:hypothetical protein